MQSETKSQSVTMQEPEKNKERIKRHLLVVALIYGSFDETIK